VRTGIGHQAGITTYIFNLDRFGHSIVSMTTEHSIQAGDTLSHFQIYVHAVMRKQYHRIRVFINMNLLHQFDHIVFTQPEGPVGEEFLRVSICGSGKSLANDADTSAVHFFDHVRAECMASRFVIQATPVILLYQRWIGIFKQRLVFYAYVLANKIALEQRYIVEHLIFFVGKFPVANHHIQAQDI